MMLALDSMVGKMMRALPSDTSAGDPFPKRDCIAVASYGAVIEMCFM